MGFSNQKQIVKSSISLTDINTSTNKIVIADEPANEGVIKTAEAGAPLNIQHQTPLEPITPTNNVTDTYF
jgi:hypothetical protein